MSHPKFFLLLLTVFFVACAPDHDSDKVLPPNDLEQAQKFSQEGKVDEALHHAEKYFKENPKDERGQQIYASILAQKAGLSVSSYWSFLVGYDGLFDDKKNQANLDLTPLTGLAFLGSREAKALVELGKALATIQSLMQRIQAIPYVGLEKREYLHTGIDALENSETAGARLFRAILITILLRSSLQDGYISIEAIIEKDADNFCTNPTSHHLQWYTFSAFYVLELPLDLARAFPKSLAHWRKESNRIRKLQGDLLGAPVRKQIQALNKALCAGKKK